MDVAVQNLTNRDNHCKLPMFTGGRIDVKIVMDKARLFVYYNLMGDSDRWETCIMGKNYPSIHMAGYVGVSAGNPSYSDINEVDVEAIDFFNLNE